MVTLEVDRDDEFLLQVTARAKNWGGGAVRWLLDYYSLPCRFRAGVSRIRADRMFAIDGAFALAVLAMTLMDDMGLQ